MMDSSARCEDDLTHKLIEIVRANNHLRRQLAAGTAQHLLNDFVAMLQVRGVCVLCVRVACVVEIRQHALQVSMCTAQPVLAQR